MILCRLVLMCYIGSMMGVVWKKRSKLAVPPLELFRARSYCIRHKALSCTYLSTELLNKSGEIGRNLRPTQNFLIKVTVVNIKCVPRSCRPMQYEIIHITLDRCLSQTYNPGDYFVNGLQATVDDN